MPSISFRRFLSSSLALAFVIHTCRAHGATSPTTLTTTALDRSSSGWFAASACTATAEGHQTTRSGSSISRTAPHPAAWTSTSSLLQRSCSHHRAESPPGSGERSAAGLCRPSACQEARTLQAREQQPRIGGRAAGIGQIRSRHHALSLFAGPWRLRPGPRRCSPPRPAGGGSANATRVLGCSGSGSLRVEQ
jgi:hypothetical protein